MSKSNNGLSGVGNSLVHQVVISDLLYAIRKRYDKKRIKDVLVLSEISLSKLGYECGDKRFAIPTDYNYDLGVVENGKLKFVLEVERSGQNRDKTKRKLKNTLKEITDVEEIMLIEINEFDNELHYFHYAVVNNKIEELETSSYSVFLDMTLAHSLRNVFRY